MMSQVCLADYMGIEMCLHLVDGDSLNRFLEMDWAELKTGMDNQKFRNNRPKKDPKLHRIFDIDCESEFLDIADNITGDGLTREVFFKKDDMYFFEFYDTMSLIGYVIIL